MRLAEKLDWKGLKNTKLFNFSTHLQRKLEECPKLPLYVNNEEDKDNVESYLHGCSFEKSIKMQYSVGAELHAL
jgi:hypothetical protein